MPIAFDAVSDGGLANGTSQNWSHTCTGSDLFLVVGIKLYGTLDITSVTYNGVAMTEIGNIANPNEATYAVLYGLIGPGTGSNTVAIARTSSNFIASGAASYTGVSQSGQPEANGTDSDGLSSTCDPTATVVSSNAWLAGVGTAKFTGNPLNAFGGQTTQRSDNSGLTGVQSMYDSAGTVGTGAQGISFGQTSVLRDLAGVVAVLAPAVAGGAIVPDSAALTLTGLAARLNYQINMPDEP